MEDDKPQEPTPKIARSAIGLRDALFEQLERIRDGKAKAQDANAFASLSNAIINSAEMQIKYQKLVLEGDLVPGTMPELEGPELKQHVTRHRLK